MITKTILFTGAGGYLGFHVAKKLADLGANIISLLKTPSQYGNKNNFTSYMIDDIRLEDIFLKHQITGVVHLATCYGRNNESIADIIEANITLPTSLLNLAIKYKADFFVNTDTVLPKELNAYALSKSQFRDWLTFYSPQIQCFNMRLDHFYGPFEQSSKFVANILKQLKNNVAHIDLTPGLQERDFIYIDDAAEAYTAAITQAANLPLPRNIANFDIVSGRRIKIKDAVQTIASLLGNTQTKLNFGAVPYRKNEPMFYATDNSSLKTIGWQPKITFEEGIKKIIQLEEKI